MGLLLVGITPPADPADLTPSNLPTDLVFRVESTQLFRLTRPESFTRSGTYTNRCLFVLLRSYLHRLNNFLRRIGKLRTLNRIKWITD